MLALGSVSVPHKAGVVLHVFKPGTREVEAGGSEIMVSLSYTELELHESLSPPEGLQNLPTLPLTVSWGLFSR